MSSSETTRDEPTADSGAVPAAAEIASAENSAEQPEDSPGPSSAARRKRGPGIVAWLALLFSAVALVAIFVDFRRDQSSAGETAQNDAERRTLTSSVDATQNALLSLEQTVTALGERTAEQNTALDRLSRQLNDRLRQLESVPGRMAAVESSMASLQGISTGARAAWLLAEAEYYMQIANAQLQLARNPELAALALTHADERILQLGDPRLINIRQSLADELRALDAMDRPDTAGITLTLASLAAAVESLPLAQESIAYDVDSSAPALDPDLTGMDRAMASLRNAVDGIVSVRRSDEQLQPLIAPEARFFLRANLALQLQTARLALLRGEEVVFRQSLDDANAWLEKYYDLTSTAVQSARETIVEIRGSVLIIAMPDISGSLRQLRQFNSLADAASAAGSRGNAANGDDAADTEEPEPRR
jgi:uroporphyrin-3 C-methyltransferase